MTEPQHPVAAAAVVVAAAGAVARGEEPAAELAGPAGVVHFQFPALYLLPGLLAVAEAVARWPPGHSQSAASVMHPPHY